MKTIYKKPRLVKPEVNQVQGTTNLVSTGNLRIEEGTKYDLIISYGTPIAYVVDVENGLFINETKVILCNEFYSRTTRKHQAIIRDRYSTCSIGEFELGGFVKRAELDGVNVLGGWNN